jgi:hypothetical protein
MDMKELALPQTRHTSNGLVVTARSHLCKAWAVRLSPHTVLTISNTYSLCTNVHWPGHHLFSTLKTCVVLQVNDAAISLRLFYTQVTEQTGGGRGERGGVPMATPLTCCVGWRSSDQGPQLNPWGRCPQLSNKVLQLIWHKAYEQSQPYSFWGPVKYFGPAGRESWKRWQCWL